MQFSIFEEDIVYEYFILLSPNWPIKAKVRELKDILHGQIGLDDTNLHSIAHISLYKQKGTEGMHIAKKVKKALAGQKKFTIALNGHDVFKQGDKRTLFLKIEDPAPIDALIGILNPPKKAPAATRQTSILDKPKRARKTITPHLTIARNITKQDFERITDFSAFDYHGEWECDKVTISKRIWGTTGKFEAVAEVPLA